VATDQRELIRDAIAVMTAWASDTDTEFAIDTVLQFAEDRHPNDEQAGPLHVLAALGTLCGLLLDLRERETGVSTLATLQELGRQFADE
jgi:hypothetical protein